MGNRDSIFVDTLLCAGLGSRLPINEPIGSILLHIGHGSSQVGVMTLSGLAASKRTTIAGHSINKAIVQHLRNNKQWDIGIHVASEMKESIGNAETDGEIRTFQSTAKNTATNQFQPVEFSSENIVAAIQEPLSQLVHTIKETVATLSPELCADIIQNGVMVSGGGAQLMGIDDFLSAQLCLPVFTDNSYNCLPSMMAYPNCAIVLEQQKPIETMEMMGPYYLSMRFIVGTPLNKMPCCHM